MHGYSSSEESDDPRRPKTLLPTSSNVGDQKKKKKPKPPPQASINHTWKTFQKRTFNKALSVLPFDPVAPSAGSDRPNELISAGYERAAEQCRVKVKKIIQECRRVNSRYRDPHWDIDFDLRYEEGYCLNSLGSTKWNISKSSVANAKAEVPKAVKRVHEIFKAPTFLQKPSGEIKQGSLGNCWLIACFTALANVPGGLQRICVEYDTRIGIYGFVFFRDGEWIYSIIDDKLYLKNPNWDSCSMQRELFQNIDRDDQESAYRETYQTGSKALFFAQCKDQNETWVPLLEKAYAKAHGDYACLSGGWIGEAAEDLTGGVTTEKLLSDILDLDSFWTNELMKVNEEFVFGASTGLLESGYGYRDGISERHAYNLLEAKELKSGERILKFRNPWGKKNWGNWNGPWSDGSKEWTPDVIEEVGHQFGSDSDFWMSFEDFMNKFQHLDRTKLFCDPAWHCVQRWIGVDVPWKSQYHEKFQVKLTKDSPFILTLSQLDARYFKGLAGQYRFHLHFRIHEKNQPDAEDSFVRSHGNYFMNRSVSIDVPDMPAGEYSVFVRVTAERNTSELSVEDVVKREVKDRIDNEKLAQVGQAYDLAHSKGTANIDEAARLRKKKEQEKASASRRTERRRLWEKRHLNRQATHLQKEKNAEKKEARRTRKKEERRLQEDLHRDQACQTELAEEGTKKAEAEAGQVNAGVEKQEAKEDNKQATREGERLEAAQSPKDTPVASRVAEHRDRKSVPASRTPSPDKRTAESDGDSSDSSDSPVEDWEAMYSDDDMGRKPGPRNPPLPKSLIYESEDEGAPAPWNAICILGVRVYSMDKNLQLRVVQEGGHLAEGMGKVGEIENSHGNVDGECERDHDITPDADDESQTEDGEK